MDSLKKIVAILEVNRKIAAKDPRLLIAGIFPILIIFLVGIVFTRSSASPVGVVDLDTGAQGKLIVKMLAENSSLKIRMYPSMSALQDDILRQHVVSGIYIPRGFSKKLEEGKNASVVLLSQIGNENAQQSRVGITQAVATLSSIWNAADSSENLGNIDRAQAFNIANSLVQHFYSQFVKSTVSESSPYQFITAAQTVLFVFLSVVGSGSAIVEVRRSGIIQRIMASPTSSWVPVLAYSAGGIMLGIAQSVGLLLIGKIFFGASYQSLTALATLIVFTTLAAASLGTLLGVVARTAEQALAIAIVGGIALGMLGGCIWPLSGTNQTMRIISFFTPQGWAMDAFSHMMYKPASVGEILLPILALGAFAIIFASIALWRFRKVLLPK